MKKLFCLLFLVAMASGCDKLSESMASARRNANEDTVQKVCKVYFDTIISYKERNHRLPRNLEQLNEEGYFNLSIPYNQLILESKPGGGYYYQYDRIDEDHFIFKAKPAEKGITGNNSFSINEVGEIKVIY